MNFIAAILIALGALWIAASSSLRHALGQADHAAETRIEPEGAKIAVSLIVSSPIGKAEYHRRLVITNSRGQAFSRDLQPDHGGFAALNLYRREDGRFVIASPIDGPFLLDLEKPSAAWYRHRLAQTGDPQDCGKFQPKETGRARDGLMESGYIPGFFYVGSFDFRMRSVWAFLPADERPEKLRPTGVGDFWDPACS